MKLQTAVNQYITYRKSLGDKFITNEHRLKRFVRVIGSKRNLADVQTKKVNTFLAGEGPVTSNWHSKYSALHGFYNYVISRGYVNGSPLPIAVPKIPQPFRPYIYSVDELRTLLDTCLTYQKKLSILEPYIIRTLLLLLYGAGLRISEAIKLTLADVNLPQGLLTIRETKFFKSRLVPIGSQLTQSLTQYAKRRQLEGYPQNPDSPFFIGRNRKAINSGSFKNAFRRIRKKSGIRRTDNIRFQPRLHDFRHTFAVHRLTAWYKEGADVQKLLPILSVYLGHTELKHTSVYLTMTPELLEEAGRRFQNYAFKEDSHD